MGRLSDEDIELLLGELPYKNKKYIRHKIKEIENKLDSCHYRDSAKEVVDDVLNTHGVLRAKLESSRDVLIDYIEIFLLNIHDADMASSKDVRYELKALGKLVDALAEGLQNIHPSTELVLDNACKQFAPSFAKLFESEDELLHRENMRRLFLECDKLSIVIEQVLKSNLSDYGFEKKGSVLRPPLVLAEVVAKFFVTHTNFEITNHSSNIYIVLLELLYSRIDSINSITSECNPEYYGRIALKNVNRN